MLTPPTKPLLNLNAPADPLSGFGAQAAITAGLIALAVGSRLINLPWNVSALAAAALLAGFVLRSNLLAISVPVVAMLISDLFHGGYDWREMLVVYAAMCIPVLLGRLMLSPRMSRMNGVKPALLVLAAALAGSFSFFVLTNASVFMFSTLYAKTPQGLAECFTMALPFFRNTLAGDAGWALVLFGLHAAATTSAHAALQPADARAKA